MIRWRSITTSIIEYLNSTKIIRQLREREIKLNQEKDLLQKTIDELTDQLHQNEANLISSYNRETDYLNKIDNLKQTIVRYYEVTESLILQHGSEKKILQDKLLSKEKRVIFLEKQLNLLNQIYQKE
jgi:hypothetical protein